MSAAFAASAAYAARRVVQKLSDVEIAVWFYADKVQAGEYRQDRAAGLQNDVSRKIMQAFQQCSEEGCSCVLQTRSCGGNAVCWRPSSAYAEIGWCRWKMKA